MFRNGLAKKSGMMIAGILAVAISLAGCASKEEAPVSASQETVTSVQEVSSVEQKETASEAPKAEWRECTEEEAKAVLNPKFAIPEGFELVSWSILDDGAQEGGKAGVPMVQMILSKDMLIYDARAQVTGDEFLNICCAEKPEWSQEKDERLSAWGDDKSHAKSYVASLGNDQYLNVLTWYDEENGISYSLHTVAPWGDSIMLVAQADSFRASDDAATQVAESTTEGANTGSEGTQQIASSNLFYESDINYMIDALIQDMGLVAVAPDDGESSMYIGGDFIGKYGYKDNGAGGYQNYYTFYNLGDAMTVNVTVMGWPTTVDYDYGVYTFDTVKTDLISRAQ